MTELEQFIKRKMTPDFPRPLDLAGRWKANPSTLAARMQSCLEAICLSIDDSDVPNFERYVAFQVWHMLPEIADSPLITHSPYAP